MFNKIKEGINMACKNKGSKKTKNTGKTRKCGKQKGNNEMLEGKVIKSFNDKQNNLKHYEANGKTKFRAEDKRYNELKEKDLLKKVKRYYLKIASR